MKILNEMTQKYKNRDFIDLEIILSELMREIISIQEANFDPVFLLKSDIGKFISAIQNIYSKFADKIPLNVRLKQKMNNHSIVF